MDDSDTAWLRDSAGDELKETRQLVLQQNRRKKKGMDFQSIGKVTTGLFD